MEGIVVAIILTITLLCILFSCIVRLIVNKLRELETRNDELKKEIKTLKNLLGYRPRLLFGAPEHLGKIDLLYKYLGIEYVEKCTEELPFVRKINKKKGE